jgi:hypothetical protein
MIIRFFARGKTGKGAIEYIINESLHPRLEVLRGDPEITKKVIRSLNYSHKYTSGVLAFSEIDIKSDVLNEIIDQFEAVVFAGLQRSEYNYSVVKHTEKGRTELHFVIANVNLQLNRVFKPFYYMVDLSLFNDFKDLINMQYGFSNPNDIKKRNAFKRDYSSERAVKRLKDTIDLVSDNNHFELKLLVDKCRRYESRAAIKLKIHEIIGQKIADGTIRSRDDVVRYMRDNNLNINRIGSDYISIRINESDKPLRMKGSIYGKDFRNIEALGQSRQSTDVTDQRVGGIYQERIQKRLSELKRLVENGIQKRAARFEKQYRSARRRNEEDNKGICGINSAGLDDIGVNNHCVNESSILHGAQIQDNSKQSDIEPTRNHDRRGLYIHTHAADKNNHDGKRDEIHSGPGSELAKEAMDDRIRGISDRSTRATRRSIRDIEQSNRWFASKVSAVRDFADVINSIAENIAGISGQITKIIRLVNNLSILLTKTKQPECTNNTKSRNTVFLRARYPGPGR